MGVCCSNHVAEGDLEEIELSPTIDAIPPPEPDPPEIDEPEPVEIVVQPAPPPPTATTRKVGWDGGRPKLTLPPVTPKLEPTGENEAAAKIASKTEQRSLSSTSALDRDNSNQQLPQSNGQSNGQPKLGKDGKPNMYADVPMNGDHIPGEEFGATKIQVNDQLLVWLKKVPLLAKLNQSEILTLAGSLTERFFRSGYRIVVEGDVGDCCFILSKGSARVTKWQTEAKTDAELCVLSVGDFFGEAALLSEGVGQRGATITAVGQCHCYLLPRDKFRNLLGKERLNVQFQKRAAISDNTTAMGTGLTGMGGRKPGHSREKKSMQLATKAPLDAIRTKNPQTQAMLLKVVMESVLFANIDEAQRRRIVDTMWLQQVPLGEVIIQQGDIGEHWFVIDQGKFDIFVTPKTGGPPNKVSVKERGAGVGELALLYNAPRAATVKAATAGSVWVLDRMTYRGILTTAAEDKRHRYEAFLKSVKAFDVLIDSERSKLAEALEEVAFEANTPIVTEGEMGDTFYIILSGTVSVSKAKDGEIIRLKEGDYFGERSVIKNEPRAATCTAITKTTCLSLKSDAFKGLLGSMDDIFRSRQEMYTPTKEKEKPSKKHKAEQAKAKQGEEEAKTNGPTANGKTSPSEPVNSSLSSNYKLSDLKVIGTLGKGSFGTVQLVKDKSGATYALKIVAKQSVVDLGQQEHILNEKRTMSQLNHPFLIRLFATFKDQDRLYFLLEASLGGELFTVLRSKSSFPETTARFYAAGIVLAFEFMHAKGIIYRDLKPENLLLDSKGYLKVTDFGFAKKVNDGRTWTLCGTPDYLAPEVVSGQGHGKAVDWWTLGILIFEMIAGYPPFYDEDPMKTYGRIMSGNFSFPMHFSKSAMDLIRKLLNPKASKRYGSLAGGATLIKNHPWFAKFDWNAFLARRLPAPIILPVKSPEDMSNFERGQLQTEVKVIKYKPPPNSEQWDKDF